MATPARTDDEKTKGKLVYMPGDQPKAHHFIQQKYLEAFSNPVPHEKTGAAVLWVHSANQPPRRQVPRECAVENYFYCHEDENGERSFLGEKFLGDLESASADVLRAAQGGKLPATLRDRFTLTDMWRCHWSELQQESGSWIRRR